MWNAGLGKKKIGKSWFLVNLEMNSINITGPCHINTEAYTGLNLKQI